MVDGKQNWKKKKINTNCSKMPRLKHFKVLATCDQQKDINYVYLDGKLHFIIAALTTFSGVVQQ
jgi:hypothetical protein